MAVDIGRLVDLARDPAHEAFENPHRERHVEQAVRQRHGDVRVEQAERRIELEERQQEYRRRRHPVGQQPEEQVLVAEEAVARKGIGRRQRSRHRDHRVQRHIDQRVGEHGSPAFIAEHLRVIVEGQRLRPQREAGRDLDVRLETHRHEPVDRRQQEEDVERRDDPGETALFHGAPPVGRGAPSSRVITV